MRSQSEQMKRLRHILFSGLAVISALLCVAALVLWPRSYFHSDEISRLRDTYVVKDEKKTAEESNWWIDTQRGALEVYHEYHPPGEYWDGPQESKNDVEYALTFDEHPGERALESSGYLSQDVRRLAGFARQTEMHGISYMRIPLWPIALHT